jgi:hypothetical protein
VNVKERRRERKQHEQSATIMMITIHHIANPATNTTDHYIQYIVGLSFFPSAILSSCSISLESHHNADAASVPQRE